MVYYDDSLKYKITIRSHDGSSLYYIFDSSNQDVQSQTLQIYNTNLHLSSTMSQLTFMIEDSDKSIDKDHIRLISGSQVTIQIAKDPSFFSDPSSYAMVGYIDYVTPVRNDTNTFDYAVNVYESKRVLYDTQINFIRSAPLTELSNPLSQKSNDFTVRNHIRRLLEKSQHTVLGDVAVKDRAGFGMDISKNLDIVMPNLTYTGQSAGRALDDITNMVGAVWFVRYKGGDKIITADYPQLLKEKITIKSGDLKSSSDAENRTSYISSSFQVLASSAVNSGFATRLFAKTKTDKTIVAASDIAISSTTLTNKAIAQPFSTNETSFNGLGFIASKVGSPESPKNRLNGAIFLDKDGKPEGPKLTEFHVPLDDIDSNKTVIFVNLDDIRNRFIENSNNTNFWIVWYQRSGTDGDPNTDEGNTIRIWRNINSNGGSLVAQGGDEDKKLEWKAHGPTYAYTIYSSLNRLFAVTNYSQVARVGYIEPDPLDLNDVQDVNLASRYLSNILYMSSIYKGEVDTTVTNPDNFIFKPYQQVRLVDSLSYPQGVNLELHDIDYTFDNTNEVRISGIVYLDNEWPANWPCSL